MDSSINMGRLFGIPLRIHFSWFIIFALLTAAISTSYYPPNYPLAQRIIGGVITSILFFASVLAHELAHSVVAIRNGIPVRNITLFIFGGVSQITREATRPISELIMALAGPVSSIILSLLFYLIHFATRGSSSIIPDMAYYLFYINMFLAIFNLIPGFPLDGGRVFRAILWKIMNNQRKATRIATISGQVVAYLMILAGVIWIFVLRDLSGLWLVFVGWFLENAASSSRRQLELREALRGYKVQDVMSRDCQLIEPTLSIRDLVNNILLTSGRRCFIITREGKLVGLVTFHNLKSVPQDRWPYTTIQEVMTPSDKLITARPEDEAVTLLDTMDENDINQIPVIKGTEVVGIVGRDNLIRFIRNRSELGL